MSAPNLLDRTRIVAEDEERGQTVSGGCRAPNTQRRFHASTIDHMYTITRVLGRWYRSRTLSTTLQGLGCLSDSNPPQQHEPAPYITHTRTIGEWSVS